MEKVLRVEDGKYVGGEMIGDLAELKFFKKSGSVTFSNQRQASLGNISSFTGGKITSGTQVYGILVNISGRTIHGYMAVDDIYLYNNDNTPISITTDYNIVIAYAE